MTTGSEPDDTASDCIGDRRFVQTHGLLWRQFADVTLVRTVGNPEVVELWGTGPLLWRALVEPISAEELASDLAAVINAPLDDVTRDVHRALSDLAHRGLITQLERDD